MTISNHIIVSDAAAAAAWYTDVFGAEDVRRVTLPDGRLIDVNLRLGPSMIVLADEFPEHGARSPAATGCTSVVFYLECPDVDATWERALAAGASVVRPLADVFWGAREGQVIDPFGHRWGLSQHLRDVPVDEVARGAAVAFGYEGAS